MKDKKLCVFFFLSPTPHHITSQMQIEKQAEAIHGQTAADDRQLHNGEERGHKGLRNAECGASLDTMEQGKKENTNKSTMKSSVPHLYACSSHSSNCSSHKDQR